MVTEQCETPPSDQRSSELPNLDEMKRALRVLAEPGQTVELRAVGVSEAGEPPHPVSKLFTDQNEVADKALALTPHAKGIYITLNPVAEGTVGSAHDADIERRVWFPVDVDPQRQNGTPSSEDEHEAALKLSRQIRDFLTGRGWPAPVEADSGNGAHLLYKIDLPNDDASKTLVETALKALDFLFSDERQQVDTGNFNAARIWKLYGTLARKGEDTPERPHRMARLLNVPEHLGVVSREQLEQLAALLPNQSEAVDEQESNRKALDLATWLKQYDIAVASVKKSKDYTVYRLPTCPWSDEHSDGEDGAAIMQFSNGALAFRCHHAHCLEKRWFDFRAYFQPEYSQRPTYDLVAYDGVTVPAGYKLSRDGVVHLKAQKLSDYEVGLREEVIATAPIFITGRLVDVDSGEESLRLVWLRGGRQSLVVSRGTLMNARDIVGLASVGFPVNSATAQDIVKYLTAFEKHNLERLPVEWVSGHMGWQGKDGEQGFLWGREMLAPDGATPVTFKGADGGEEQVADGYRTSGTFEGWIEGVRLIKDYPIPLLDFYAGFAPPLLRMFGCANFTVDVSNRTSTGKSTSKRVAASLVGDPERIIHSWDTTRVGFERLASVQTDLPLFLDDTKQAKKAEDVGAILYDHGNGHGRGRGTKGGLAHTASWRSVLQSTGEGSAVEYIRDAGARGRVLTLKGMPFGSDNAQEVVEQLNATVAQHYGHAFPLFVRFVLAHREEWAQWKAEYDTLKVGFARMCQSAVAGRLAAYMAAIAYTAKLVHRAFAEAGHPLEWDYRKPLLTAWKLAAAETTDAAVDIRALREVYNWACQNRHNFWTVGDQTGRMPPNGGWLGRWDGGDYWMSVTFHQLPLKQFLISQGYRYDEVLEGWKSRGWLALEGRRLKTMRIDGVSPRVITVQRTTFASIEEVEEAA